MKLCIIQCYLYLSHARWRNFAWHLLWLSTTERKNIVKVLAISHTRQFQLFSTDLPSNFWKIAWLPGNIKNAVSSRFISLSFPSKNRPLRQNVLTGDYLIVCTIKKGNNRYLWSGGKTFTPCSARTIIFQGKHLKYLVICLTQCTLFFNTFVFYIASLFAVRFLWEVCNKDKCCVLTHHAADTRVAFLAHLACLRSHVLRANCNFESKQAISITLFGRRQTINWFF